MKNLFTSKGLYLVFFLHLFSFFYFSSFAQTCTITGNNIVCSGDAEGYSTSLTGSYNYQWNAFGGMVSGSGAGVSVNWGSTATGQVSLVVRNASNNVVCSSILNVVIALKPVPVITPSVIVGCGLITGGGAVERKETPCFNICDSTWVTYTTPGHPGSSYTWTITGAADYASSSTNSIAVYWTGQGPGMVSVTETNANGCTGTSQVCVKVVGKPNSLFTSLNTPVGGMIAACKDQTIQFQDLSTAGAGSTLLSYEWQFGDGNSVAGVYPGTGDAAHAYAAAGTYPVMLIIENECHCKDTFQLTVQVSSQPGPDIFCVSAVCPYAVVTYHTNAVCGSYNWSVTNGTIQGSTTDNAVTVMWGNSGPGIITLSVTGCPGFCTTPTSVFVPVITPDAQISGPSLVCIYNCYKYHLSCDIPIDSIAWHFPSGVTVNAASVNRHEVEVCFYGATFTSGDITADYYHYVPGSTQGLSCGGHSVFTVKQRPQLVISAPAEICDHAVLTVSGITASGNISWTITSLTGTITYYTGSLPAGSNLSLNWSYGPGTFVITAAGDTDQYCNGPQQVFLKVNPAPPKPDSIEGPEPVCMGIPYTYFVFQTSSSLMALWKVENGTPVSSAGNGISVIWNTTGPYILKAVQVDLISGCVSDTLVDTTSSMLPLSPLAVSGDTSACANNQSTHFLNAAGDDFVWSVSPAIAGSVVNGQHSGNITMEWNNWYGNATLSVVRTVCGQTVTSSLIIPVNAPPVATITALPVGCQGSGVPMTGSPAGVAYNWDFGDGTSASVTHPVHVYHEAGNYLVTLTITYGGNCTGTSVATAHVMINPKPNITISTPDPNLFCGPGGSGTVNMFVAGPVVSGVSYDWYDFSSFLVNNTAYSTNARGSYYVIGTNGFGCKDTSNVILIDSVCDTCRTSAMYGVTYTGTRFTCNTDSFSGTFTPGGINPRWNFDDPFSSSNVASGTDAVHFFKEPGYYRVKFCVDVPNLSGTGYCQICRTIVDTIQYTPDFYDSLYCVSGIDSVKVKLINNTKRLSTLPIPAYNWSVTPGGYASTLADPLFTLPPGNYTVSLMVAGVCIVAKMLNIPGFPDAAFTANDSICVMAGIPFTNASTGAYTNSTWAFGDGAGSLITNPTRVYSSTGSYDVLLLVTNAFGCNDSISGMVQVLPNTLTGNIIPSVDTSVCEGDSIFLTVNASGGYPAYNYLWSDVQHTQNSWAKYTGTYYVNITDARSCFYKTGAVNVRANPLPRPEISGNPDLCVGMLETFSVNYPAGMGYTIKWILDAVIQSVTNPIYYYFGGSPGTYTLVVKVSTASGCMGTDTFHFTVHPNPVVNIISSGILCEGQVNQLIGTTSAANIVSAYWNNGSANDTLITSIPGDYAYTVADSFGCTATLEKKVNPLPDFCGMLTGCYEICDTVQQLVWYAPPGYAAYKWYYNGSPLAGATHDTIHIPLYQPGNYQVEITTANGCKAKSDPVEISFAACGITRCVFNVKSRMDCGPVNAAGNQTYTVTMDLFNSLGAGAGIGINTTAGSITGLSSTVLAAGLNTITFTFADIPPVNPTACFSIDISNNNKKCDTTACFPIPLCNGECNKQVTFKSIKCAGFDAAGNPVYNLCADITWGGSTGSTLTMTVASGMFVPNPVILNTGSQSLCFTYTDLSPYGNLGTFYFNFFDQATGKICRDSVRREYKNCKDSCKMEVYGMRAECKYEKEGVYTYDIGVTVFNPYANATATLLPVSAGIFGPVTPNPVGAGSTQLHFIFTDNLPVDTVLCFRVLLTDVETGTICWQDVCIFLPSCGVHLGLDNKAAGLAKLVVAPNPAHDQFKVYYSVPYTDDALAIDIVDITGKLITHLDIENRNGIQEFSGLAMQPGVYFVNLRTSSADLARQKLVIVK